MALNIPSGFISETITTTGVANDIWHYGGSTDSQINTNIHIAAIIASQFQKPLDVNSFRIAWGANVIAIASARQMLINDWNDPTKNEYDIAADISTIFGDLMSTASTAVNFLPGVNEVIGKRLSLLGNILTGAGIAFQNIEEAKDLVNWAHTQLVEISNEISLALYNASNAVVEAWEATKTTLLDAANSVANVIENVGTAAFDASVQAAMDLFDGAEAVLTGLYNSTGVAIQGITEVLTATGVAIYDAGENLVIQFNTLTDKLSDSISAAYWKFLDALAASLIDPLIIDTAGNGIKLDSWQTSTVLFDLDGNGSKENTGWTKANGDDAFLVIDKNNDGKINDITEMFGNRDIPGFKQLATYDSNKDGVINTTDTQFNLLKLWNDKNANGVVDAGELTTLAANNITSISLNKYSSTANISGNMQTSVSSVTKTDGTTKNIHELNFGFESLTPVISNNRDATLPSTFQLNIEAIVLPYSRGYGSLYSWQAAMTLDPTLLAMAKDLATTQPKDFYLLGDKFEAFLFRWAGVQNVTSADVYDSAFGYIPFSAKKTAFMEKITGGDFFNRTQTGVPLAQQAWDMFYNYFLNKFLVQSVLHDVFPNASYDFATDKLTIGSTLDEAIAAIKAKAINSDSFTNYIYYAENILKLNKDQFNDVAFDSKLDSLTASIAALAIPSGFTFDGRFNVGSSEIDILYGTTKNDILHGDAANDELYGFAGNDYFVGGKGNDILKGDAGNDFYRFMRGDGQDSIDDNAGVDKILLGDGISAADLVFAQVGNDLVINIGTAGDKIGIKNFYVVTTNRVETIQFADGSTFSLQGFGNIITGTDLAETINGSSNNDVIKALGGNDTISGGIGHDIVTGGKGNDTFSETGLYSSNDTYIFNVGDGQDVITDWAGTDYIVFGAGITKANIQLISDYANNKSLIIKVGTNGDQITIKSFFNDSGSNYKIESLKFADGSVLDLFAGLTLSATKTTGETLFGINYNDVLTGNIGADTIYGNEGNDTITGGKGNDILDGGSNASSGNDTYIFNVGDGQDVITDRTGTDQIVFGAGITKANIQVISDYANERSLIVKIGTNGDQIRLGYFFNDSGSSYKIETLKFADGSVLDLSGGLTLAATKTTGETLAGASFNDNLTGNIGADTIYGYSGNDTITGGNGNDTIYGNEGNDTINGGKGNDIIDGGSTYYSGNDIYIFNVGDGQDTIYDYAGIDQIVFGAGITKASIKLISDYANSQSLIIKIGTNGDQITLQSFFYDSGGNYKIETLKFADGSVLDLTTGLTLSATKTTGETLFGIYSNDILTGNIGADTIYGNEGNDIITGGKGNDIIDNSSFYSGNDTYIFNVGDGQDTITDYSGTDQIVFGAGIAKAGIQLISDYANSQSLIIKVGTNGDQITLKSFFSNSGSNYKIESLKFADGSIFDLSGGLTLLGTKTTGETLVGASFNDNLTGNIGNDTIYGYSGNDTINAGKGNDIIDGSTGNDVYIFNIGDGQDTLSDYTGADQIVFGAGIVPQDILMEASGTNLIISYSANDRVTINNFFTNSNYRVETLKFADGRIIDITKAITVTGSAADDIIIGTPFADNLSGAAGNDYIYGSEDIDIINGGIGNDILRGGGGVDTYNFDAGYGSDILTESGGVGDKIVLGTGILSSTMAMIRVGDDLRIVTQGKTDSILVSKFFATDNNRMEYIQFADGTKFNLTNAASIEPVSTVYSVNGYVVVNEDVATKIKLLNKNDGSADYKNIIISGAAVNGTASVNTSGDIIYTSKANYFGTDSFTISYKDAAGVSQSKTISVNVAPVNDAPVGLNKTITTNEDTPVEVLALVGATDIENNTMTIYSAGGAAHGSTSISGGKLFYTPSKNYFGTDSFTYTISDGNGGFDTKTVNATIISVNDAPVATNDVITISEDSTALITILSNDSDVEDGFFPAANIKITTQPTNGTVAIQSDGKVLYTPKADFYGQDSFKYTVTDSQGLVSNIATATINVTLINDSPKFKTGSTITFTEDTPATFDVNSYFYDPDGNAFTINSVSSPNASISFAGNMITYTPKPNYNGIDKFTITLKDSFGATSTLIVDATVTPVNDIPVATNDSFVVVENTATKLNVLANDNDVETVLFASSITGLTTPAHGTVSINATDGTILYTPTAGYNGMDSFTYSVKDSNGIISNTATATINVAKIINGTTAANSLSGIAGNEVIYALDGNDTISGSTGVDILDGGVGTDTVSYAASTAAVNVNLSATTAQSGGHAQDDTLISIENIIGSPLNDTFTGSSVANNINGGAGIDTVSYANSTAGVTVNLAVTTAQTGGFAAGDIISNIENLTGSAYNDTLLGTSIANIINGGLGNDKMTGGSGADIFKFSAVTDSGKAAGARDIITDFVKGSDKIDLGDFAGIFTFKGTGALGGSVPGVNYAQVSGNTIIGIDADGNGTLDMQIELTGLHTLAASDFLL
ncbi:MAG: calcium-binding protein [Rickettsiales bacterium]